MRQNELILSPQSRQSDEADDTRDDGDMWDLPPESDRGTQRRQKRGGSPEAAERDAASARGRGDTSHAVVREADTAEHRQEGPWGGGDLRTWGWIALMFFGFLAVVALCYFLPQGRHAAPPPVRVY